MEKSVTSKQLVVVIFILGVAMKTFLLPSILLKAAGRDSIITMLAYLLCELMILLLILITAKRMPDRTFFEIGESVLGKVGMKILVAFLTLYFLCKLNLTVGETQVFFTVSVFNNLEWAIYVVPILIFLFAVGLKSLRAIGRVSELCAPLILGSILLLSAIVVSGIDFQNLLPIMAHGVKPAGNAFLRHTVWAGDFSVMIIFIGHTAFKKRTVLFGTLSAVVASVFVLFFTAVICATYGNLPTLIDYGHNLSNMTQYVGNSDYGRYDLVVFCVWIVSVFMKMSVSFYAVTRCVSYVVGKENYYAIGGAVCAAVYLLQIVLLPNQNVLAAFCALAPVRICAMVAQLIVPLFLFVVSLFKGGKRNDNKRPLYADR